jgi:hypothetical protein
MPFGFCLRFVVIVEFTLSGSKMSIVRHTLVAILLGSLLAMPSAVRASIKIDFESDTVGSAPGVNLAPGNPMTQPSAIGGYAPDYESPPTAASGTIVVGTPSGASKEAVMTTNSANKELGALWMDVNGFTLPGQKTLTSFDINVLAAPENATSQPKSLGGGTAGILLGLNVYTASDQGSDWSFRFAAAPTSATGGVFAFRSPDNLSLIPFFNYDNGSQYNVSILADYSTGKLNAYVDGMQSLTDYAFWAGGGKTNVVTDEMFFHLNGEDGFQNSVSLDNIRAAAVPEPTTLVVWSLMGICISAFAWKSAKKSAA